MATPGIIIRHRAKCPAPDGGRCKCKPAYLAWVYDAASDSKHRKTFSNLSGAKAWRASATGAVRRGELKPATKQSLAEYAEAWLDGIKSGTILARTGKAYKPA